MHEQFYRLAKIFTNQFAQTINFPMRFMNIEIPRHRKVTIEVYGGAIFDNAEIVQINPVGSSVLIQRNNELLQQLFICLIHNTSNRTSNDFISCVNNDECKQQCQCAVYPT